MGASLVVELAGRLGVRAIQISSLYMVESLSSHSLSLPPAGVFIMEDGVGAVESNSPVGDVSLVMTLGNGL